MSVVHYYDLLMELDSDDSDFAAREGVVLSASAMPVEPQTAKGPEPKRLRAEFPETWLWTASIMGYTIVA